MQGGPSADWMSNMFGKAAGGKPGGQFNMSSPLQRLELAKQKMLTLTLKFKIEDIREVL